MKKKNEFYRENGLFVKSYKNFYNEARSVWARLRYTEAFAQLFSKSAFPFERVSFPL